MTGLAGLLSGTSPAGVYRWAPRFAPPAVAAAVGHAGWSLARVDGASVHTRRAALVAVGEALGFPPYYGANLDALADCLRDLPAPTVLLWDLWSPLAYADEPGFAAVLGVLREHAAEHGDLAVLLRGPGPEVGVPTLD